MNTTLFSAYTDENELMDKRTFKNHMYDKLAMTIKALANPKRLEIIDLLAQGPFSVEQIAQQTDMSMANASQHLQVLKAARLVNISRRGTFNFYDLSDQKVFEACRNLRELGLKQNPLADQIIKEFRKSPDLLESVTLRELQQKLISEEVIILDVRPTDEYRRGHIPQALSVPIEQLADSLEKLPKTTEIIAYCRGPLCVYADDAVQILLENGYQARRLEEGFPDWQAEGLPVATSS